jgi:hypothetical protein
MYTYLVQSDDQEPEVLLDGGGHEELQGGGRGGVLGRGPVLDPTDQVPSLPRGVDLTDREWVHAHDFGCVRGLGVHECWGGGGR